jgi:ATP-dependent Clp protease ATP-binding subunit ClpC
MFERYTESARRALFFARYESSQLGSVSIEPEHLLLGLLRDGAVVKAVLMLPLEQLREEIKGHVPFREQISTSVEIPFSHGTKRALHLAAQEADDLGHGHIGCEHLLLGLLRDDQSPAASVLAAHGVRLADVRAAAGKLDVPRAGVHPETAEQIAQIKAMVAQLGRSAPDSPEAQGLVTVISAALDALLGEGGLR